jgi:hypothetical protein
MLTSKITEYTQNTVLTVVAELIPPIIPTIEPTNLFQVPEINLKDTFLYGLVKPSVVVEQVKDIVVDLVDTVEEVLQPTKPSPPTSVPVPVPEVPVLPVLPPPSSYPPRRTWIKMAAPLVYHDRAFNAIQFLADFNNDFSRHPRHNLQGHSQHPPLSVRKQPTLDGIGCGVLLYS